MQLDVETLKGVMLVVLVLAVVSRCAISLRIHLLYTMRKQHAITTEAFSVEMRLLKGLRSALMIVSVLGLLALMALWYSYS